MKSTNYCEEERKGWDCNFESGVRDARADDVDKDVTSVREAGAAHWEEHSRHWGVPIPCWWLS